MEMKNMEKLMQHILINPKTGEPEYFFPLEIKDDSVRAYAEVYGYASGYACLGNRVFPAVMIPCRPDDGRPVSAEEQKRIYCKLVAEELMQEERRNKAGKMAEEERVEEIREELKQEKERGERHPQSDGLCLGKMAPDYYGQAELYLQLCEDFLAWVKMKSPELLEMATLLAQEYDLKVISQILNIDVEQAKADCLKLQQLASEFLL